ncbi:TonB-dependent receptor plug domain-containing protein [Larkinella soli]|uniref:TonB-dependent receptor plug domain-containing protein n=1 Tax=Larkinella soli TaxID=1770527 RepID=UPI000FFC1DA8|nr:TonB-dependent receptor plug domain-containing protein [Larkinella soli]
MKNEQSELLTAPYAQNVYPKSLKHLFRKTIRPTARLCRFLRLWPALLTAPALAQVAPPASPSELKKLSLEQLMDVEVTLVSRTPQKLSEVASAIQVLTGADIRRSGATNIPEALRLIPNLQVAQLNASTWIISARGFNTIFANKLLVMIDGRTVYTPFFGGVLWEQQNIPLEDVERIEVVSGPGGTLWGANAVNGVINIVTKSSAETQGAYVSVSAGNFLKNQIDARYGGRISDQLTYRIYGQHFEREPTLLPSGDENRDRWRMTQGGFRVDWAATARDQVAFTGNFSGGARYLALGKSRLDGQNVLGRWTRRYSEQSELIVQLYYDRYYRNDANATGSDRLTTYDFDFQHRFPIKNRHSILWGLGYRLARDFTEWRTNTTAILPNRKDLPLYTGFVQDEIALHPKLKLTLGTKLLHNVYSGFELQPSARLAWAVRRDNLLWAAVSRAVRTPSRLDVDYFLPAYPVPPTQPSVAGGPNFVSEKVVAWELGYRWQPAAGVHFSLAGFYNVYRDIYSVEALPGTLTYQIQNGSEGESWGGELAVGLQVSPGWRLRGGYTYLDKDLRAKPGRSFNPDYLGNDVKNRAMLQSMLNLPAGFQLDLIGQYFDYLPKTLATARVPSYLTFDARLAWSARWLELALVGQNLAKDRHIEFGTLYIPRSYYAKISARF